MSGEMAVAYFMNRPPRGFFPLLNGGELEALYSFFFASSEESVGDVRLRQFAKCMVQRGFRDVEGAEAVGFSHGQFGLRRR
jgi:hypothetical protein